MNYFSYVIEDEANVFVYLEFIGVCWSKVTGDGSIYVIVFFGVVLGFVAIVLGFVGFGYCAL